MKKEIKSLVEFFPAIAHLYRYIRHLMEKRKSPLTTPWGFTFVGNDSMAKGNFEPIETIEVLTLLKNIDVFVNIGANVGYYCCHALNTGKPVVAIEPNLENLDYLMENISNNGWKEKAEIFPVALSSKSDIMKMYGGGTGASLIKGWASISETYVSPVPVLTLDRVIGDSLCGKKSLILADVEGVEYDLLLGATKTLLNDPRPIWMLEITTIENQPSGIKINPNFLKTFDVFFKLGYRAFTVNKEQKEITRETIHRVIDGLEKLDVHNFMFQS